MNMFQSPGLVLLVAPWRRVAASVALSLAASWIRRTNSSAIGLAVASEF
jgi:hypothetical protein